MKIKINENETYEINVEDEFSPQQFQELLIRLTAINKLIRKDPLLQQIGVEKRTYKVRKAGSGFRPWAKNRDEAVRLLKLHYFGKKPDKLKYAEANNLAWDDIIKAMHTTRQKWQITPEEIGVPFFPSRGVPGRTILDLKGIIAANRLLAPVPEETEKEETEDVTKIEEAEEETEEAVID